MKTIAFWMVWSPQGSMPAVQHETRLKAINEAERLARGNPGREFYVLEAIEGRTVNDMTRVRLEAEVPF